VRVRVPVSVRRDVRRWMYSPRRFTSPRRARLLDMSTPKDQNSPVLPASSPIPGELTLQDLEKLAGGASLLEPTTLASPPASLPVPGPSPDLQALLDPAAAAAAALPVEKKVDSSYTSYFGATGTSGNEAALHLQSIPINLQHTFP
jgi:hypothetical protein